MSNENNFPEQEEQVNVSEENATEEKGSLEETHSAEDKTDADVQELKDKYLRLYSEFENYRRRTSKEKLDMIKTASESIMQEIIPTIDDFERGFKALANESDAEKVKEGTLLIYQKLIKTLAAKGLKPMDDLIGKPFDAETQEAITQIPSPSEELKGAVIDVVEKGYVLGDKVIRFAKVVIGA
jgi:molecular chaperone GrpE